MRVVTICLLLLISGSALCQYVENYKVEPQGTIVKFGVGIGLDFGGLIGGRLTFTPVPKLGIFGALGYNLHKASYNTGLTYKFRPDKRVSPYVNAMYGYNAVIIVDGADQYNKTYYGFSLGGGIELNGKRTKNYWSFGMNFSLKPKEYFDDMDMLRNNPSIDMGVDPLPVTISVGYHFNI